jgi:4-hydroxy-tetrahydrodipicolinate reductase
MKIAILGYGKMGKEIEKMALERNHQIGLVIDISNTQDLNEKNLSTLDVAIDFSTPDSAYQNIINCFRANLPIVSGTTGWLNQFDTVINLCREQGKTFFYASNFSLGVNIFFKLNKYLAHIMNTFNEYDVSVEEIHHVHKLDAPSGTAITLSHDLIEIINRKNRWESEQASDAAALKITSIRENEVPGTHVVVYDSTVDSIEIKHASKNREGLALGAILAAEFIQHKKGYFTMNDLLGF